TCISCDDLVPGQSELANWLPSGWTGQRAVLHKTPCRFPESTRVQSQVVQGLRRVPVRVLRRRRAPPPAGVPPRVPLRLRRPVAPRQPVLPSLPRLHRTPVPAAPRAPLRRARQRQQPPLPELLRVELDSVSSRRSTSSSSSAAVAAAPPEGVRAYPLPNSNTNTEYLVEEDLQVVLKPPSAANPAPPPPPTARNTGEPSQQLAAAAERALSSSVTPTASFRSVGRSSSRWSSRWSSRYDAGSVTAAATAEWWWNMDGGVAPASRRAESEDGSAFYGFVRWLTGAY
ncbi:verprolin-like, partial [Triticum aestivum]|uniref:verprolin-like n=1 Tax=Triticum aestivum TaxID=4565 RepID=UPI001D01288C